MLTERSGRAFERCLEGVQTQLVCSLAVAVHALDVCQCLAGLALHLGGDGLGRLGERVANALLLGQGLAARGLPLAAQRCGHAFERGLPGLQALLVGAALLALLLGLGGLHLGQQRLAALLKGLAEAVKRLAHTFEHAGAAGFVLGQGGAVGLRHARSSGAELCVELGQLLLGVLQELLVHVLGLFGQLRHGFLHHGADAVAGHLHALAQAGAQRLVHRLRQARVGRVHFLVEAFLIGHQAFVDLFAGLGHLHHHGLQLRQHLGQGLRLLLQGLEGFLALVREREAAQAAGDAAVQRLARLGAFAAGQAAHQAQHGRGGHTSHRGAKGQA